MNALIFRMRATLISFQRNQSGRWILFTFYGFVMSGEGCISPIPYHHGFAYSGFAAVDVDGDGDLDPLGNGYGFTWYRIDAEKPVHQVVKQWWSPKGTSIRAVLRPSDQHPSGMVLLDHEDNVGSSNASKRMLLYTGGVVRNFTTEPFPGYLQELMIGEDPLPHLVAFGDTRESKEKDFDWGLAVADFSLAGSFDWNNLAWRRVDAPPEFPDLYDRMFTDKGDYSKGAYHRVDGLPFARFCYYAEVAGVASRSAVLDVIAGEARLSWLNLPEIPNKEWRIGSPFPLPCEEADGRVRRDCMLMVRGSLSQDRFERGPEFVDRLELSETGEWSATSPTLQLPSDFIEVGYARLRPGQGYEFVAQRQPLFAGKNIRILILNTRTESLAVAREWELSLARSPNGFYWYDLNDDGLDDAIVELEGSEDHVEYLNRGDGTFEAVKR